MAAAALYMAWIACSVALGTWFGVWNLSLLKDTVIWFLVAGLALFGGFVRVNEDGFARRRIVALLGITTLIEYQAWIVSFPLAVELFLQPFVVFLSLIVIVSALYPEYQQVETAMSRVLGFVGLAVIAGTLVQIIATRDTLDGVHLVLLFYLPFWLTAGALLFVYGLGLVSAYEQVFYSHRFRDRDR